MNTRFNLKFVRAVATVAAAAAVSLPCAAQYGVSYGPAYPMPLQSHEQWQQILVLMDQVKELDQLIAEIDRQMIARCSLLSKPGQLTPQLCFQLLQSTVKEQR